MCSFQIAGLGAVSEYIEWGILSFRHPSTQARTWKTSDVTTPRRIGEVDEIEKSHLAISLTFALYSPTMCAWRSHAGNAKSMTSSPASCPRMDTLHRLKKSARGWS